MKYLMTWFLVFALSAPILADEVSHTKKMPFVIKRSGVRGKGLQNS